MSVLETVNIVDGPTPDPAPSAPPAEPELTPGEQCRAELTAFTDHVLLARKLVLASPGVPNQQMCADGVGNFMVRCHLAPYRGVDKDRHPAEEPSGNVAKAEERIRTWCASHLGGDIEDFSDVGLGKRLDAVQSAHRNWQAAFREQCISSHRKNRTYISVERMAEVFPQLDIAPWEPMYRVEIGVTYDYLVPASLIGDDAQLFQNQERDRLLAKLGELAEPVATRDGCLYSDTTRYVRMVIAPL